ncbi:FtsH protease activity modulator HflK [Rhodanobacter glycinis]|uniref:Protein HflK n=1 Tax=Rhodanobacter glycinis TaxID=582702 RepID=A0A5B9E3U1_9GAMM|nr:FtsH protease activity modulator HflK [Rhodanobacter glycinis]QEE25230.1 FtsH protease activity modulator HflK [Rhodanobacter glycinis]
MAWNEPGNGQRDPWNKNNRPSGNKPGLDATLKNLRKHLGKFGNGPGGILTIIAALLLAWLLLSSYTVIGANQSGVVLRFGHYSRTLAPGFHLKLPQPIESVSKVATTNVRSVSDQVRMLTSDENIVSVNFNVQYQVSDARKFLFSTRDPEDTLREAAEAAVRAVVGSHSMDDILTGSDASTGAATAAAATAGVAASAATGVAAVAATTVVKPAVPAAASPSGDTLQQQTRDILQHTLNGYDIGLQVTDVSFQNVAPPQEVKDAFDDVNAAREDKQGTENKARAYASKVIPQARGDAARILAEAAGYKASRIARAQGDTEQFDLILAQYKAAPEVTRRRLWLETMEKVLANDPKVIDGSGGRNIINLPFGQARALPNSGPDAATTGAVVAPSSASSDDAGKEKQP